MRREKQPKIITVDTTRTWAHRSMSNDAFWKAVEAYGENGVTDAEDAAIAVIGEALNLFNPLSGLTPLELMAEQLFVPRRKEPRLVFLSEEEAAALASAIGRAVEDVGKAMALIPEDSPAAYAGRILMVTLGYAARDLSE